MLLAFKVEVRMARFSALCLVIGLISSCAFGRNDGRMQGECSSQNVRILEHPGPTRGAWDGSEDPSRLPDVPKDAEFTFVFDRAVDPTKLAQTTQFLPSVCAVGKGPIPAVVRSAAAGFERVAVVHAADPGLAQGCAYELRFAADKSITGSGTDCLDGPRILHFRTRSAGEQTALRTESKSIRYFPREFSIAAFELRAEFARPAKALFERYSEDLGLRPFIDTFVQNGDRKISVLSRGSYVVSYEQRYLGIRVPGFGYMVREDSAGRATEMTGHAARGISLDIHPRVPKETAVANAEKDLAQRPSKFPQPSKFSLTSAEIVAHRLETGGDLKTEFRLAWQLGFDDSVNHDGYTVIVDATNGRVLTAASMIIWD